MALMLWARRELFEKMAQQDPAPNFVEIPFTWWAEYYRPNQAYFATAFDARQRRALADMDAEITAIKKQLGTALPDLPAFFGTPAYRTLKQQAIKTLNVIGWQSV